VRIYPYPSSAHRHRTQTDPHHWSIGPSSFIFGSVHLYVGTHIMIRGSLSPPPQMGNGGLPPALLPSSTALDSPLFHSISDFPYVAAKWMHPPARAPKWMLEWTNNSIKWYTILGFCSPHHWIGRGRQEDLRFAATGEHPWPRHDSPVEAAYQAWKCAVDNMWQSHATLNKHHALIATRAKIETELACQARQKREL
jgi:hypothetical protein